ncbi:MAG: hypothetical protein P9X22_00190 [Candidatus Zapsychrus exili]|nr:hypothetical protein [Candidatus Zapsychrus exili]
MAKRNIKKILVGVLLIVFAILGAIVAFYYLEVVPELEQRTKEEVVEVVEIKEDKEIVETKIDVSSKEDKQPEIKPYYDKKEVSRKEGFLWFDRKSSKLICTLGSVQGLSEGSLLTVYYAEKEICKVEVKQVFDVISYVEPKDQTVDSLSQDYYRAIISQD